MLNLKSLGSSPFLYDSRANYDIQIDMLFSVNDRNINTSGFFVFFQLVPHKSANCICSWPLDTISNLINIYRLTLKLCSFGRAVCER